MDRLMYDCWRAGYKMPKILEKAQLLESQITRDDVEIHFRIMFDRELSDQRIYL
jgi:hypothetical protein